jgi:hypothetical protein
MDAVRHSTDATSSPLVTICGLSWASLSWCLSLSQRPADFAPCLVNRIDVHCRQKHTDTQHPLTQSHSE